MVKPEAVGAAMLRGGFLVAMYVAFYAALPFLALSTVATAYYTGPLLITLLAAALLKEKLNGRDVAAVFIGFAGVLVIMRPGTSAFSPVILLPVVAAAFYALANVMSRGWCRDESHLSLSIALNFCFVLCGGTMTGILALLDLPADVVRSHPFLLGDWVSLGSSQWIVLFGLALANVLIHVTLAKAYQSAPAKEIAPFDYCYLLFAALWGFLIFGEVPDFATVSGMGLIVGAGLLVVLRR